MLGILLTILKIIGIILLVLIGLILLAAAVILLVPIRYHGEGAREEKILSGNVKLTWLLHMISASASLSEDGTENMGFACLERRFILRQKSRLRKAKQRKCLNKRHQKSQRNQKSQNSSLILYLKMLQQSTSRKSQFQNCQRKKKRSLMRQPEAKKMDETESEKKPAIIKKKNLPDQM